MNAGRRHGHQIEKGKNVFKPCGIILYRIESTLLGIFTKKAFLSQQLHEHRNHGGNQFTM